jgi:hypothetical protein
MMNEVRNPVTLSVIQHRQNRLESSVKKVHFVKVGEFEAHTAAMLNSTVSWDV